MLSLLVGPKLITLTAFILLGCINSMGWESYYEMEAQYFENFITNFDKNYICLFVWNNFDPNRALLKPWNLFAKKFVSTIRSTGRSWSLVTYSSLNRYIVSKSPSSRSEGKLFTLKSKEFCKGIEILRVWSINWNIKYQGSIF